MGQAQAKSGKPQSLLRLFIDEDGRKREHIVDDPHLAKYLIKNGADVNEKITKEYGGYTDIPARYGETPVELAVRFDTPEIAEVLIDNGAEISNWYRMVAWHKKYYSIIKILIEKGRLLNENLGGESLIYWCVGEPSPITADILKLFIDKHGNMTPPPDSESHLEMAVRYAMTRQPDVRPLQLQAAGPLTPEALNAEKTMIALLMVANPESAETLTEEKRTWVRSDRYIQDAIFARMAELGRPRRSDATLLWQTRRNAMRRAPPDSGGKRTSKKKKKKNKRSTRMQRIYRFK
jgi:hypothetical protein